MSPHEMSVSVVSVVRAGHVGYGTQEAICHALELVESPLACRVLLIGDGTVEADRELVETGFGDVPRVCWEVEFFAPGAWAKALAPMLGGNEFILLASSPDGRDVAPRLALELGSSMIAGALNVTRTHALVPRVSGRALLEVPVTLPVVVTVQPGTRSTERETIAEHTPAINVDGGSIDASTSDAQLLEVIAPQAHLMELAEAPFIVGAGIGLGTVDVLNDLQSVAKQLGATVGATRVVTDEGWLGHEAQIGTTGVVVDPDVYVAFGISGAVQHTAGLGSPRGVICVNIDAHCPMMQRSDLAIVADAPAVIESLRAKLVADAPIEESET